MVLTMFKWALAASLDITMPDKKIKVGVIIYDLNDCAHQKIMPQHIIPQDSYLMVLTMSNWALYHAWQKNQSWGDDI